MSSGDRAIRYGASSDIVIHPGVIHDVTTIRFDIHVDNSGKISPVVDLQIEYEHAAQRVVLSSGKLGIAAADLVAAIVPQSHI